MKAAQFLMLMSTCAVSIYRKIPALVKKLLPVQTVHRIVLLGQLDRTVDLRNRWSRYTLIGHITGLADRRSKGHRIPADRKMGALDLYRIPCVQTHGKRRCSPEINGIRSDQLITR